MRAFQEVRGLRTDGVCDEHTWLALVEASSLKTEVPQFEIGDTVDVHTRILEGEKERIQIFNGVVIARSGSCPGMMLLLVIRGSRTV